MKNLILTFCSVVIVLMGGLAFAATYDLDKRHTQIIFSASHAGFSNPIGTFNDFDGVFEFDENGIENSNVEVTINTNSIDFNDDTWNQHMSAENYLNVEEHPTITFKSTSVTKTGDKTMDVIGDLTFLGQTKPVTLKVNFSKVGAFMGKTRAGFEATTMIDRTEYGMTYNAPVIGADVDVRVIVEGVLRK